MTKKSRPFLKAPEGVKIRRHNMQNGEIRFTTLKNKFQKLVAIWRSSQDRFVWIHSDYSA